MTASFWVFLIVCIISFVPVIRDHGKAWNTLRRSTGTARQYAVIQLAVLWAIPILSFVGTVLFGFEASRPSELVIQDEPRSFTELQKHNAPAFLGRFHGTPFVLVSYADPDSTRFGEQLLDLLKTNQWNLVGMIEGGSIKVGAPNEPPKTTEPVGVLLEVNDANHLEAAIALDSFLKSCVMRSQVSLNTNPNFVIGGSGLHVWVGTKQ